MRRPVNLAQLSPLRRGLILGFMRAKRQSRKELRAMAQSYDDELLALRDEFHQLAVAHHRRCYDAAVDEAIVERGANPYALLHCMSVDELATTYSHIIAKPEQPNV